jgi:hypothetical protein
LIGLTPRSATSSALPGETFTALCGSPFVPVADNTGRCVAELNSRRTLAIATLAVGGVALVVLTLATWRRS